MKRLIVFGLIGSLFLFLAWSDVALAGHPVTDNDEGIYLTSFLLIRKGFPAYAETFFSQPPGFLLSLYPLVSLSGNHLETFRLGVAAWSLVGIGALFWIGKELGKRWFAPLASALLYLIPHYYGQTLVLQSDAIVTTFTLLSLGALFRFLRTGQLLWFAATAVAYAVAFWTKFDVTFLPPLLLGIYLAGGAGTGNMAHRRERLARLTALFAGVVAAVSGVLAIPFGVGNVFSNTVWYRMQSEGVAAGAASLVSLLSTERMLSVVLLIGAVLVWSVRNRLKDMGQVLIFWAGSSLLFFSLYRPFFPHHLAILAVPVVVATAYVIVLSMERRRELIAPFTILLLVAAIGVRMQLVRTSAGSALLDPERQEGVAFILRSTKPGDGVVSDEAIFSALSGRLPPPELSDLSYVRIASGNMTSQRFAGIIQSEKPALIVAWNGRLKTMNGFPEVLSGYRKISDPSIHNPGAAFYRLQG